MDTVHIVHCSWCGYPLGKWYIDTETDFFCDDECEQKHKDCEADFVRNTFHNLPEDPA